MADRPPLEEAMDDLLARAVDAAQRVRPEDVVPPAPRDLTSPEPHTGEPTRDELRRLTVLFSDVVGSTSLSSRLDPETYRRLLAVYTDTCRRVIEEELDGHLVQTRGDGILAVFGYPIAHEDDALRAVKAGLQIHRQLAASGTELAARVGVHRGLVYVEHGSEELYGFAVNVAARIHDAASPGEVVISEEVHRLVGASILTTALDPVVMKGVDEPPRLHTVVDERRRPAVVPGWSAPLIGRGAALAELRSRHERVLASDHPVCLVVTGEPGVGKTRLVNSFLDELPRRTTVLELAGSPFQRHQGLHPVRQLLHRVAGLREHDSAARLDALRDHLGRLGLEHHLPLLAPVAGLAPEAGYDAVAADPRLLEGQIASAVHDLLVGCLSPPSVAVVEDLHWMDDATVAAVGRLVADGPPGLLVLVTSRTRPPIDALCGDVLDLEPLDVDDCVALIRHHAPDLGAALEEEMVARCDGIPLFVEELVRSRGEAAGRPPGDHDPDSTVPSALYDPLCARLNAMSDLRVVVSAAATIGRTVNLEVLARVTGLPTDELDRAVALLIEEHIVEPGHGDTRVVRFRHELVRQVAYELEPPSGRQHLHARVAHVLASGEVDPVTSWPAIAEHHLRGGAPASAVEACARGAADARRRGSLAEARGHLDRALDALDAVPADDARAELEVDLRLDRAFLAVSSEGFASEVAAADYRRCLELSVDRPHCEGLYQTLIALWGYYVNRADLDRAWSVSTALRPLSVGHRAGLLPTNTAGFGMIAWHQGRFKEAVDRLEEAVAGIAAIGAESTAAPPEWTMPLDPVASMHVHLALARSSVGDPEGAGEQLLAARARCAELPFPLGPFTATYIALLESFLEIDRGAVDVARGLVHEAWERADRHGFDAWLFWASMTGQLLDVWGAPPADARAVADQVSGLIGIWDAIGARVLSPHFHALVARLLLEVGDAEGASVAAAAAIAAAGDTGANARLLDARRLLALAGPPARRADDLILVVEDATRTGALTVALHAATDLVRTAGAAHLGRLAEALEPFALVSGPPDIAAARALLAGDAALQPGP